MAVGVLQVTRDLTFRCAQLCLPVVVVLQELVSPSSPYALF